MAKTKSGGRNKKASVKSSSRAIKKKLTLKQVLSILGKEGSNKHRYYMKISNDKKTGAIQFDAVESNDLFFLGTQDLELIINTVMQIVGVCSPGKPLSEISAIPVNAALASIIEIDPQDSTELMLASQMVAVHSMAMEISCRAMYRDQSLLVVDKYFTFVNKLMRTFSTQVETLNKYRSKGQQITVKHQYVSVTDGGQAVIGDVNQRGGSE